MNILIILRNEKNIYGFTKRYGVLMKHIREWGKQDNKIYIITGSPKEYFKDLNIQVINTSKILFNKLFLSVWFGIVNHPRFDIIIDELSVLPFIYKKSEKVIYLSDRVEEVNLRNNLKRLLNNIYLSFVFKYFLKDSFYLVSTWDQISRLKKFNIKENKVYLLQEGIEFLPKLRVKRTVGKNIGFVSRNYESIKNAVAVFKELERREEGWIYYFIIVKELFKKAKEVLVKEELIDHSRLWQYESEKALISQISKTDIILDLDGSSIKNIILCLSMGIPVVTFKSELVRKYQELQKSVILTDGMDYQEMARVAMAYVREPTKYKKIIENGQSFTQNFSWKRVSEKSSNYLESIRPD